MIDHNDSFTYNLVDYFRQTGVEVKTVNHCEVTVDRIEDLGPRAIILSPGPGNPDDAPNSIELLKKVEGEVPVLGVCLGFQIIVQTFGGSIIKAKEPMHGKVEMIKHDQCTIYRGLNQPTLVTRYHSLIADKVKVPREFQITSETDRGEVMSIRHHQKPIEGVQFHPEAILTSEGKKMIQNFVDHYVHLEREESAYE